MLSHIETEKINYPLSVMGRLTEKGNKRVNATLAVLHIALQTNINYLFIVKYFQYGFQTY